MSIYLDKAEMKLKKKRRATKQIYGLEEIAWVLASLRAGFKSGASQLCDLRQINELVKNYRLGSLQSALLGCSKGMKSSMLSSWSVLSSLLLLLSLCTE